MPRLRFSSGLSKRLLELRQLPQVAGHAYGTVCGEAVRKAIEPVVGANGLFQFTPHLEYLLGTSQRYQARGHPEPDLESGGILGITDKTQFILQSSHPVRYIIEREINGINAGVSSFPQLKFLDWVAFFGRSLLSTPFRAHLSKDPEEFTIFENNLCNISTAAECGMFSSDVHQTVVDIPSDLGPSTLRNDLHLGNKYAVLVGDYFAIKTIYFTEKVKNSAVFLEMVNGVEDFATSSFVSNLLDSRISYPVIPSGNATLSDWTAFTIKSSGYFTGGLRAAYTYCKGYEASKNYVSNTVPNFTGKRNQDSDFDSGNLDTFVANLALALRGLSDLREFKIEKGGSGTAHPLLLISLPAVLHQVEYRSCFQELRANVPTGHQSEVVECIRQEIRESSAVPRAIEQVQQFARNGIKSFVKIAKDDTYTSVILDLLKTIADDPNTTL